MVKKKEDLTKLSFKELRDKAKEIPESAGMNRFELLVALKKAAGETLCPCLEGANPRPIKLRIAKLAARQAETTDKKGRAALRKEITRLKRLTRVVF